MRSMPAGGAEGQQRRRKRWIRDDSNGSTKAEASEGFRGDGGGGSTMAAMDPRRRTCASRWGYMDRLSAPEGRRVRCASGAPLM